MLGPLEVRAGSGEVLEVGGTRLRTLLIMLALRPGQLVPASQLIDGLWPDQPPAGALNALQALISRLRRALPEAVVEAGPSGYRLAVQPQDTDIVQFGELAAAGRAQLRTDPAAAAATLHRALGLWRGPALPEVAGADFGAAVAARLDEERLAATEHRIDADLLTGPAGPLVAELEELVVAHPLREPLAARLMRALHAAGRRGTALEVYEQIRKRLADELGADPSAELSALHLELLTSEPQPAPRINLPAELTSFVGRDAELAQVAGLLSAHRLLTLTGPGGAGKTRLAVEAARAELPAAPDGVWLIELAPVSDPAEVPSAALSALGLREQALLYARGPAGPPAEEQADALGRLLAALGGRRALLVLDNCEHLVAAAARLAGRVLAACPQVRILATSREPLAITGEALWTVGPLTLPPDPAVTSDETERGGSPAPAIGEAASVRLLAQRARAVLPGFEVTPANAPAVARICRALDGMPLAIELAAARLRTMSPEQVAARLDDRFGLLTGGSRIALPRHRTLRAVVDWSWDLLDEAEQVLWRRFAIFSGGATLEAAEQVCAGSVIAQGQVLDLLTALADKSLLIVRHGPQGPRYRMLEIIRAYGLDRLAEAGERDAQRQAHARYFTGLAEASQEHLLRAEQLDWLRRLTDDQDNLHAALRGAIAAGDAGTAVRLAAALGWYWSLRSVKIEGAELIGEVLDLPGAAAAADPERLAVAYAMGALLCADTPLHQTGQAWFGRAAELTGRITESAHPIVPLVGPLARLFGASDPEGPPEPEVFDDAVANPHPWVSAIARILRAHAALNLGRQHAQAEADFLAGADILAGLGERWGQAVAFGGLAMLEGWRGEPAAAVEHYRRARDFAAGFGSTEDEVQFRLSMVRQLWLLGQREAARAEVRRAQPDADRLGLPEVAAFAAYTAGDLARLDGDVAAARQALTRAISAASEPGVAQQIRAVASTSLGYLAGAEGDLSAARDWHAQALAAAWATTDAPVIAEALAGLADLALRENRPDRAAELLAASVAIRGTQDRSVPDAQRVADGARDALGPAAYGEACRRGQRVTLGTLAAFITPGA
jgi:predicted ATPase/DNA-binding SARP family transcriptional activator